MNLLIVIALISIFLGVVSYDDKIAVVLISFVVMGIFALIISGIIESADQGHTYTQQDHPERVWRPVNLADNYEVHGEIHGGFFVISGFTDTYQFFSWYEKEPDGSLVSNKVSERAGHIKIFEEPKGVIPTVEEYALKDHCTPYKTDWTFGFAPCDPREDHHTYEIHVPKGTIVHQFKLNSE